MKMNFKSLLASNLITVIIIFVLLSFFDQSGDPCAILLLCLWFVLMTSYDFIRTRKDREKSTIARFFLISRMFSLLRKIKKISQAKFHKLVKLWYN